MTREERFKMDMIDEFKQMCEIVKKNGRIIVNKQRMLKVLEKGSCEDTISRQALKDLGAECIAKRDENGNLIPLGSIDSLPSVSTKKIGRWILTVGDWNKWTCSECEYYEKTDIHVSLGWNYCPKCGAKMREVGDLITVCNKI